MWLMIGLRRVLLGFWRLLIGLVIGAVFYVWMFFNYKSEWQSVHDYTHDFLGWMVTSPYLADYSQWNTLLNLDDKLAFALFIMVGRIIWLFFESIFISFPYWLIFGRGKGVQGAPVATGSVTQKMASVGAAAVPVASNVAIGANDLEENAEQLERSIDDALDRIKHVGGK